MDIFISEHLIGLTPCVEPSIAESPNEKSDHDASQVVYWQYIEQSEGDHYKEQSKIQCETSQHVQFFSTTFVVTISSVSSAN